MFWLGATVCFAMWIAYGLSLSRKSAAIRARLESISRSQRIVLGIVLLVGSLAALFAILGVLLVSGSLASTSVPIWLWPIVALIGVGFVHAQTMGTAMLVTLAQPSVTRTNDGTSTVEGLESDETSSKSRA